MTTSAYRTAIEYTEAAIQRRARRFRYQIIVVGVVVAVAGLLPLIARSPIPLVLALTLIPVTGAFLAADAAIVNRWCASLLTAWTKSELDCAAFRDAIRAHPMLPTQTLEAMLANLPSAGALTVEQAVSAPTRGAVAAAVMARHHDRADVLLMKVIASAIAVAAVLAAIWSARWWPLTGLALVAVLPLARIWRQRRRQARWEAEVTRARAHADFSDADYARLLATVKY